MYIILVNQKEKDGIFVEKRTHAKHIILILLGSLILSFGIYNLNYQNNITEGGVLGLLLLLKNLFNIEPSIANLIIDTALLIITSLNIGNVYLIGDVAVLMLSLTYLSAYDIFWSLIAVNISGRTIDFIYNFNKSKLVKI